ncbi:TIGR03619 family F420-dependent LLM class oxidoreductase [Phytoactinopolyspora endophytica]|uniref:TIGR03619 family F420-dependent LLM class oxidoreductase n=1 Tax=Phytoactinopolyspora endophytica TaxID=1642495 RepID=UPI0013ED8F50|nr:TIGR03619 family F420-dependent LLM class oxidoreductase [Phytoactinopolyspora endophytica]
MKLGMALPTAGAHASADAISRVTEEAERIGLDSLWSFERQLSPVGEVSMGGNTFRMPEIYNTVYSPLEALAFAAARTSQIRLGTSVMVAPLHNPVALGRSLATLDKLSGGRIVAGLGQGWLDEEFEAAGVDKSRQGAGFGEFIEALRAVWGPDPVSYEGAHYKIAPSQINPKPVQAGGPPIVVGASSPSSIRRTARMGLGLNPIWFGWDAIESTVRAFHEAARDTGHDPSVLPVVMRVNANPAAKPAEGGAAPDGSPEQAAEALSRLEQIGVTEVFWQGDAEVDEQLELMSRLVELSRQRG